MSVTGMALYFLTPFPEDNIFLRVMAIRSAPAFIIFKYSYTLFLYATPYIAYSILFSGIYIFAPQGRPQDSGRQTPSLSCPSEKDRTLSRGWRGASPPQTNALGNAALAGHPGTRALHGHRDRRRGRLWKTGKLHVPLRRADFGLSRRRLLRGRQRRSDLLRTAHRHEGSSRATTTKQW